MVKTKLSGLLNKNHRIDLDSLSQHFKKQDQPFSAIIPLCIEEDGFILAFKKPTTTLTMHQRFIDAFNDKSKETYQDILTVLHDCIHLQKTTIAYKQLTSIPSSALAFEQLLIHGKLPFEDLITFKPQLGDIPTLRQIELSDILTKSNDNFKISLLSWSTIQEKYAPTIQALKENYIKKLDEGNKLWQQNKIDSYDSLYNLNKLDTLITELNKILAYCQQQQVESYEFSHEKYGFITTSSIKNLLFFFTLHKHAIEYIYKKLISGLEEHTHLITTLLGRNCNQKKAAEYSIACCFKINFDDFSIEITKLSLHHPTEGIISINNEKLLSSPPITLVNKLVECLLNPDHIRPHHTNAHEIEYRLHSPIHPIYMDEKECIIQHFCDNYCKPLLLEEFITDQVLASKADPHHVKYILSKWKPFPWEPYVDLTSYYRYRLKMKNLRKRRPSPSVKSSHNQTTSFTPGQPLIPIEMQKPSTQIEVMRSTVIEYINSIHEFNTTDLTLRTNLTEKDISFQMKCYSFYLQLSTIKRSEYSTSLEQEFKGLEETFKELSLQFENTTLLIKL